jgi:hypothetical protein
MDFEDDEPSAETVYVHGGGFGTALITHGGESLLELDEEVDDIMYR